jgi:WD40 repeat protein
VLGMDRHWPLNLRFSPDGGRLVALISSGGLGVEGSDPDGDTAASMVTWRTPGFDGETRTELGTDTINSLVFTPDGKSVITAGSTGTMQIRDAGTGKIREEFGRHPSMVRRIAISPDGRTLASVTTEDATVRLWNLADPDHPHIADLKAHASSLNDIVFSPDGTRLASAGTDTDVAVWRLEPADAVREVCANLIDAAPDNLGNTGCR